MFATALESIGAVVFLFASLLTPAAGIHAADPAPSATSAGSPLSARSAQSASTQSASAQSATCGARSEIETLLSRSAEAYAARDVNQGLTLLQQAFDLATARACVVQRAEALRRLAIADSFNLRFDAAERKLREVIPIFRQYGERTGEAQALAQLGFVLFSLNNRAAAETELLRARELAIELGDARLRLLVYDNLVYAMSPGPAKDRLRAEALEFARSTAGGRPVECNVLHQWGDELFSRDRYDLAFIRINEATRCFAEVGDRSREGRAFVSLGRVYRAHGRLDMALEQYVHAVALQQQVGDRLAAAQSFNAIGVTLGAMGRYEESLERLGESLNLARGIGSARMMGLVTGNIAALNIAMGRYKQAATTMEELVAKPGTDFGVDRLSQLSRAYLGLGDSLRARATAERAVALTTDGDEGPRITALSARARVLAAVKRYDEASTDLQRAVELVDAVRVNTIRDDYLTRGFGETYQALYSTTISVLQTQGRSQQALEVAERARSRALLDLLARSPRDSSTRTAGAERGDAASFADAVAAASRLRSTLVTYWVGESETFAWVIGEDGRTSTARIQVSENQLITMVRAATGVGAAGAAAGGLIAGSRSGARPWADLYRLLVEPIRQDLPARSGSRITIVPHGPLFGLPFAALRDSAGKYLIESYEIHYVPAIGTLEYTSRGSSRTGTPSALLVGDPGPDAARDRVLPLPGLPWADREVRTIAGMFQGGATLLAGDTASESTVRNALAGKQVVHFATHGIVQNEERLSSYLALRPSDSAGDDPATDGRLTANETYGLHLDADLVVLSGCRTALGPIMGDGVIGFTRAFLAAGAASVVATMWDVSDRTSYEVMKTFYGAWTKGRPASESLRSAQLAVLQALRAGKIRIDGVALPESPRLWAGYVIVGEP